MSEQQTYRSREILQDAHERGMFATLFAYLRLSGPAWLLSAITLGSGSLVGALYLGMLGGTSMLWLQLVAIAIGVIMLSAIGYVTLSTRVRPYQAINDYVNPVLGVGWVAATILANMIWIMPQFSLCYDALDTSLLKAPIPEEQRTDMENRKQEILAAIGDEDSSDEDAETAELKSELATINAKFERETHGIGTSQESKIFASAILAIVGFVVVLMSFDRGFMATMFDLILKLLVGVIVLCFVGVVYILAKNGSLDWTAICMGFIPDFGQWNEAAPSIQDLILGLDGTHKAFWQDEIVDKQRAAMIGVTATAVGLNMTFMYPYSMLSKGWDKPFRGLARFELFTAMAIPYLVVTSCIVIASAYAFHAKADENFLSSDPAKIAQSPLFNSTLDVWEKRYLVDFADEKIKDQKKIELNGLVDSLTADLKRDGLVKGSAEYERLAEKLKQAQAEKREVLLQFAASLPEVERRIAPTLVKPSASQFATTLKLLLGKDYEQYSDLIFGIGALAMGFSTIVILSLINSLAFSEIAGAPNSYAAKFFGALVAIICGFLWFFAWQGESKTWLVVLAGTFGAILLPIAYISFFALMNNSRLLGASRPVGLSAVVWNVLMFIGVVGALIQAGAAIETQLDKAAGPYVVGGVVVFALLAIIGFSATRNHREVSADSTH